jgi:hypothetical protein
MKYPKMVLVLAIIVALPLAVRAGFDDYRDREPLPTNYVLTLHVIEGGVTQEFSHVFAVHQFDVRFVQAGTNTTPETHIVLRGTLDPKDGKQVALTYEIGMDEPYKDKDGTIMFRRSGCTGQVLLQEGIPLAVSSGGKRSFSLKIEKEGSHTTSR